MKYVILDPGQDYAAQMVEFLGKYERQGIAVYTDAGQCDAFRNDYGEDLGQYIADEFLVNEYENLEDLAQEILAAWPNGEIQSIIPWAEFSIEMGARLGELLGVDWNSTEIIHRFRHKFHLKDYLRTNSDVRINASRMVSTEEEAVEFHESVGKWPIVVKPTQGAGSRNVFFAEDEESLLEYCVDVFQNEGGEVLLEEYIGGNEFVVNGITDAGHDILVTDVWLYDKRDTEHAKNIYYETIKVGSREDVFEPLMEYAGAVIDALGLRKSPFHMELKIDEEGPCLVEVGARFAGGNQPLMASQLHERSLFELAACHYVAHLPLRMDDINYDVYDTRQARMINGVQNIDIPSIQEIHGLEEVQDLPSFFMIGFVKPIGSYLPITRDMYGKSYEIYLIHEDPDQLAADAQAVRDLLWYE